MYRKSVRVTWTQTLHTATVDLGEAEWDRVRFYDVILNDKQVKTYRVFIPGIFPIFRLWLTVSNWNCGMWNLESGWGGLPQLSNPSKGLESDPYNSEVLKLQCKLLGKHALAIV